MIHLGSWNVGSLIGKLRELVDTATRRCVNILCIQETKWKGQKAKEWIIHVSSFGTQGSRE